MTSGTFTVTIAATPEAVWPWVADLARHGDWSPTPYRIEWLEGEPNAVGSRFRSVGVIPGDKHHANEGEVTENRPYSTFAIRSRDPQGEYANSFTLAPNESGTDVTHRIEFLQMHGLAALLLPVVYPLSGRPQGRKRIQALKSKVEGSV